MVNCVATAAEASNIETHCLIWIPLFLDTPFHLDILTGNPS